MTMLCDRSDVRQSTYKGKVSLAFFSHLLSLIVLFAVFVLSTSFTLGDLDAIYVQLKTRARKTSQQLPHLLN